MTESLDVIEDTEDLGLVKTEDEALAHIMALAQMYREQAVIFECIYKWAKRIGLDEVRRQIMTDEEKHRDYYDRFVFQPETRPGRSVVGTRFRQGQTRIQTDGNGRFQPGGRIEEMDMNWHPIGDISDIPLLGARCVKTSHMKVAVFRTNEVNAVGGREVGGLANMLAAYLAIENPA